jgi:hypothetical protein
LKVLSDSKLAVLQKSLESERKESLFKSQRRVIQCGGQVQQFMQIIFVLVRCFQTGRKGKTYLTCVSYCYPKTCWRAKSFDVIRENEFSKEVTNKLQNQGKTTDT